MILALMAGVLWARAAGAADDTFVDRCISLSEVVLGFRLSLYRLGLIAGAAAVLMALGKRRLLGWGLLLLASSGHVSNYLAGLLRPPQ